MQIRTRNMRQRFPHCTPLFLQLLIITCACGSTARKLEHGEKLTTDNHNIEMNQVNTKTHILIELPSNHDHDDDSHFIVTSSSESSMVDNIPQMEDKSQVPTGIYQVVPVSQQNDAVDPASSGHHTHHEEVAQAVDESANLPSHMDHMDPSLMVFFTMKDLRVGKTMPVYFPKRSLATSPHFLPREQAEAIPFSLEELPRLLKLFSFPPGSPQSKAMEDTLRECETAPIKGETKFCATSLESMLDFTRSMLGQDSYYKVVSTSYLTKSIVTNFQNYTILEVPEEIAAPQMVACHSMPYPYALFYCHIQESKSNVYEVLLGGEDGDRVKAAAVCHLDTSLWSHNHVSFRVLGIKPGTLPVCHFFPADNLIWVPAPAKVKNI